MLGCMGNMGSKGTDMCAIQIDIDAAISSPYMPIQHGQLVIFTVKKTAAVGLLPYTV